MMSKYSNAVRPKTLRILSFLAALVLVMGLSACSQDEMFESLQQNENSQFAEDYLEKLRLKDFEYIKARAHDSLRAQIDNEKLEEMANYFHSGAPLSTSIIGFNTHISGSVWRGAFTYEYEFEDGWVVASAVLTKQDDQYEVLGFNVYQTEGSQEELHQFTFQGKSPVHLAVFLLAIAIPVFVIITLIVCFKTPIPHRKWLWVIFIIFGLGSLTLNWSSGHMLFKPFHVQLFSSGVMGGFNSPWIFTIAMPLGAIIFWLKRKSFIEKSAQDSESS